MKSAQKIVTSANSPLVYPVSHRGGLVSLGVTPTAATYTAEFAIAPLQEGLTVNWFPIADMTAVAIAESISLNPITALRLTLDSGTSIAADIVQSDV